MSAVTVSSFRFGLVGGGLHSIRLPYANLTFEFVLTYHKCPFIALKPVSQQMVCCVHW